VKFCRVAVMLDFKVMPQDLGKHLPASPFVVGEEISEKAIAYEIENKLGYFPAIDFLKQQNAIDEDIVKTIENIAWLVSNLVREEITKRLTPAFSTIQFEKIQLHALKMPTVRPNKNNTAHDLAMHYAADHAHVSIITTAIKNYDDAVTSERMTKNLIHRWLNDHVDALEITSVNYIQD